MPAPQILELPVGRTRCYLIERTLLVDTGWAGSMPRLSQALTPYGMAPSDIRCLLVTHFHPDHMGTASDLQALGCTLLVPSVQLPHLHDADRVFANERRRRSFHPVDAGRILSFRLEDARQTLASFGIPGTIVSVPGHSPDSVALVLDSGDAFAGDLPPLSLASLYGEQAICDSWKALQAAGARCVHFAHEDEEHI